MDFPKKGQQKHFPKILLLKGMKSILTIAISVRVKKNICWLFKVWPFTVIFKSSRSKWIQMQHLPIHIGMYAWFFFVCFFFILYSTSIFFQFHVIHFHCEKLQSANKNQKLMNWMKVKEFDPPEWATRWIFIIVERNNSYHRQSLWQSYLPLKDLNV